jgi:hypothetical protein
MIQHDLPSVKKPLSTVEIKSATIMLGICPLPPPNLKRKLINEGNMPNTKINFPLNDFILTL